MRGGSAGAGCHSEAASAALTRKAKVRICIYDPVKRRYVENTVAEG